MANESLRYKDIYDKEWEQIITNKWGISDFNVDYDISSSLGRRDLITWSVMTHPSEYAQFTLNSSVNEDGEFLWWTNDEESYTSASVGAVEHDFIRKVFREIDKIIEPTFLETSPEDADILLVALKPDKNSDDAGWFSSTYLYPLETQEKISERGPKIGTATFEEATGKEYMDAWEMGTIVHEIGHALKLDHPNGDGYDKGFHYGDTVMSYNSHPENWEYEPYFFTQLDIHTLQDIWGEESNPEPAQWPATETAPNNVVKYLPFAPPKNPGWEYTEQEKKIIEDATGKDHFADAPTPVSSEDIEILNAKKIDKEYFKLSKSITDKKWAKYIKWRIGKDSEMSVYINADETIIKNKKLKKLGKTVPLSDSELEFGISVLDDIDRFCGLDFKIVDKPKKADLILSPMKMKKWEYYTIAPNGKKESMNGVWLNNGDGILDTQEKNLFTQVVLEKIGFRGLPDNKKNKYTTFDTIMSWDDEEYYGFTKTDKMALNNIWGPD